MENKMVLRIKLNKCEVLDHIIDCKKQMFDPGLSEWQRVVAMANIDMWMMILNTHASNLLVGELAKRVEEQNAIGKD